VSKRISPAVFEEQTSGFYVTTHAGVVQQLVDFLHRPCARTQPRTAATATTIVRAAALSRDFTSVLLSYPPSSSCFCLSFSLLPPQLPTLQQR
jgi:hypothetical protein